MWKNKNLIKKIADTSFKASLHFYYFLFSENSLLLNYSYILSVRTYCSLERFTVNVVKVLLTSFLVACTSTKARYYLYSYLFVTPVNQQWRQVGVRFYSRFFYFWREVGVSTRKKQIDFELCIKWSKSLV